MKEMLLFHKKTINFLFVLSQINTALFKLCNKELFVWTEHWARPVASVPGWQHLEGRGRRIENWRPAWTRWEDLHKRYISKWVRFYVSSVDMCLLFCCRDFLRKLQHCLKMSPNFQISVATHPASKVTKNIHWIVCQSTLHLQKESPLPSSLLKCRKLIIFALQLRAT